MMKEVVAHVNIYTGQIEKEKEVIDQGDYLTFIQDAPTDCVTITGQEDEIGLLLMDKWNPSNDASDEERHT